MTGAPMVLHLNAHDTRGGAARAAFRLHQGLLSIGCASEMLVEEKQSHDPAVVQRRAFLGMTGLKLKRRLDAVPARLYPGYTGSPFSASCIPWHHRPLVQRMAPDIVHLHWVAADMFRIEELPRLKRPMVWTLHDSWAFTGGCHIPFDCSRYTGRCGRCPRLGSRGEGDLSRWIWRRKSRSWRDFDVAVVAPSGWLAGCAGRSSLFKDKEIIVIPNGIDTGRFAPVDKAVARRIIGLPTDKKLLLFGALGASGDRNKGFHLLESALREMPARSRKGFELVVFGGVHTEARGEPVVKTRHMGWLGDEISLSLLYSAADVFVNPSLSENLPNTVMESMACGTPVAAFGVGGIPEMITHQWNGYLASPYDTSDLAEGILWLTSGEKRRKTMSKNARKKVMAEYAIEKVARKYIELYRTVLGHPRD